MKERFTSWSALAALAGLVALVILLAASLDRVTFTEGSPFDEHDLERVWASTSPAPPPPPLRWGDYLVAYGVPAAFLVAIIAYFWARGAKWTGRTRSRGTLIFIVCLIALALIARNQIMESLEESAANEEQSVEEEFLPDEAAPLVAAPTAGPSTSLEEGRVTSNMLQIALAVVSLGAAAGLFIAALRWRAQHPKRGPAPPDLAAAVEAALEELRWGRDAAGVVERSYRDMMRTYAEASRVDPTALTPREFARTLAEAGLGGDALDELTTLFELVHYGGRPDEGFAPRALGCMVKLQGALAAAMPTPS